MKDEYLLLLLDGEEPPHAVIQQFAKNASKIIATDGAAHYMLDGDIKLDIIIGDLDSIQKEDRDKAEKKGVRIIHESDQQTNDFEKALKYILDQSLSENVRILGIHGKRTDHLMTNFSVMLRYTDEFESLIAYDATHEHQFLTADRHWHSFNLPLGTTLSLTPLPQAQGVTTSGLYYPLKNQTMTFGRREGLGNIITEDTASVEITKGALLVSVPIAAA
jgi:thiamine pyrophosphokinase